MLASDGRFNIESGHCNHIETLKFSPTWYNKQTVVTLDLESSVWQILVLSPTAAIPERSVAMTENLSQPLSVVSSLAVWPTVTAAAGTPSAVGSQCGY